MARHSHHDLTVLERLEKMEDKGSIPLRSVFLILISFVAAIGVVIFLVYGAFVLLSFFGAIMTS